MSMWEYASLPQNIRKDMIKNGNENVYNAEIQRSNYLINARKSLGLDTSAIENWKKIISESFNKAAVSKYKVAKYPNTPVFASGSANKAINKFNATVEELVNKYNNQKDDILNEAQTNASTLREWLNANGLSENGKTGSDKMKAIETKFYDSLDTLKADFNKSYESAKSNLKNALK